ncbi:MAG: TonB-dependent receptor family protein [Asticcacaulis sp.]
MSFCRTFTPLLATTLALIGGLAQAQAQVQDQDTAPTGSNPLTTVLVIGERPGNSPGAVAVEPVRLARLSTLPDLFSGTPGVLAQTNFGGVDHPRLSIRGSGLQRGTQPAGRGVELRLNDLPMTYADTSFDFVEWVEPLAFDRALVLRGGRAVLNEAATLGGAIDFRLQSGRDLNGALFRAETGSFESARAQLAMGAGTADRAGYLSLSGFSQTGERAFSAQQAGRVLAGGQWSLNAATSLSANLIYSDSELELPGPLTLKQIEAGALEAQPGNVNGDWRRWAERARLAVGIAHDFGPIRGKLDLSRMATSVEFRRRDVQVEDNTDWALSAELSGGVGVTKWRVGYLGQRGTREVQQYLNGGGTLPSFTGARGLLWADNTLTAERDTLSAGLKAPVVPHVTLEGVVAYNRHSREISDRFPTRSARPGTGFDRQYEATTGLVLLRYQVHETLELFASASRTHEPPTWDVLLINANGLGMGSALVNGTNPRRPVVANLGDQAATTVEIGARGRVGPVRLDLTVYRSHLKGELVSTTDPVSQTVSSVGNADKTRRLGVEAFASVPLTQTLQLSGAWTWTQARFDQDPRFGNNTLPIVPEHAATLSLDYHGAKGLFAGVKVDHVPEGGFADYANSLRAEGYTTLGARMGWDSKRVSVFLEGRNLTDERYVSTVIAAQNNLGGQDNASFAPGEGVAVVLGVELKLGR